MSRAARVAFLRRPACAWLAALGLALACGPGDPVGEVERLHAQGRYRDSLLPLQVLIETRPDDPQVHYLYGVALSATGQQGLAIWPLRKAMESPAWATRAGMRLASALLASGDYDGAAEVAGRVLEGEPDHVAALSLRAMARVRSRRDYEGALADAERAIAIDPDDASALVPRVVALLALERTEEAGEALHDLERRHREQSLGLSGSPLYCTALASFAKEKGDFAAAEERYGQCLEEHPADAVLVEDAVDFFDRTGRRERSDEILRNALERMPEARGYRVALALRVRAAGDVEQAEALLREATTSDVPEQAAQGWADLATHFLELERYDDAAEAMSRASELAPEQTQTLLFAHADALILAERYDEALALAPRLEVPAQRALVEGRVALERGDPARALERLGEGLRLWPDNAVARYYAGLAAERLGDLDRAIEEHRYAVRIDPRATDAYLRLAHMYAAQGHDERALSVLRHRPGGRPQELEASLLRLRLEARRGRAQALPEAPDPVLSDPAQRARVVAAVADGMRERGDAAAAVRFLRGVEDLDPSLPEHAEALRALVESLAAAGEAEEAVAETRRALAAHPEAAVLHALHALALERSASPEEARAAYRRALELDPDEPHAQLGAARLAAAAGEAEDALAHYARAAQAEPAAGEAVRGRAEALVSLGRGAEAEALLRDWVADHPWDGDALLRLARLVRDREAALAFARQAQRFGGGSEAAALVERLGSA